MFSLVMAFVLLTGIGVPASAYHSEEPVDQLQLVPVDMNDSTTTFGVEPLSDSEDIERATPTGNSACIREITVHPIIYVAEDDAAYLVNGVTRSVQYTAVNSPSESLRLSSAQMESIRREVASIVANTDSMKDKTVGIVGWNVYTKFQCRSAKPQYVLYTPQGKCLEGNEERKIYVNVTNAEVWMNHNFLMPADINSYYFVGCDAAFYFNYTSGGLGGILMSGGLAVNA